MNQLLSLPAVKIVFHFLQATPAVPILLVLMFADVLSGLLAAFYTKKLNSSVGWKGVTRKTFVILLVGVASAIDPLTPQAPEANIVAMFYIANELLSILENAVLCGVPVPPVLVNAMVKAREFTKSEKREELTDRRLEQSDKRLEQSDKRMEQSDHRLELADKRLEQGDHRLEHSDHRTEQTELLQQVSDRNGPL